MFEPTVVVITQNMDPILDQLLVVYIFLSLSALSRHVDKSTVTSKVPNN